MKGMFCKKRVATIGGSSKRKLINVQWIKLTKHLSPQTGPIFESSIRRSFYWSKAICRGLSHRAQWDLMLFATILYLLLSLPVTPDWCLLPPIKSTPSTALMLHV